MIREHLEASGVRVDGGRDEGVSTSLAIATLAAGIASYDFRIEWDVGDLSPLPVETRCLHTGSLATALPPGKDSVVDLMKREHERGRVTVSYDPNVRPALLGEPERARPESSIWSPCRDVVKVSDEDLAWLYPDRHDEDVARQWLASGPALVVVTRGGAGVYAVSANVELRRGAVPIDLVDTVGAGDSFTSGLLDGLHRADLIGAARRDSLAAIDQATLESVIEKAAMIAAITCSRPGADPRPAPSSRPTPLPPPGDPLDMAQRRVVSSMPGTTDARRARRAAAPGHPRPTTQAEERACGSSSTRVDRLPHALRDGEPLERRLAGHRPACSSTTTAR